MVATASTAPVPAAGEILALIRAEVPELALDLDEWTRRMMRWHFSPETGSPFWTEYRDALPFDPLRDVRCLADLRRFGPFDKGRLRRAAVRDLLPRGFADRPFRIFETGGSSGAPCRILNITRLDDDVAMYAAMLRARGLYGLDIVAMTPAGPHAYGHFAEGLADHWRGALSAIDFDPRWVKETLRRGGDPDGYLTHLVGQTLPLLRRREAGLLFTTTKLLLVLAAAVDEPLAAFGIRAVCTGGTSGTAEEERYLREEFLPGVQWIDTYGNTLVGHALPTEPVGPGGVGPEPVVPEAVVSGTVGSEPVASGPFLRSYHLVPPFGEIRVADPEDWRVDVPVGVRGRVVTTTLLKDLFIPNLIERDTAVRTRGHPWFPWDGVAAVRPLETLDSTLVVEGVY